MLKAGDLARRVRESKSGKPDEIGGYHMYELGGLDSAMVKHSHVTAAALFGTWVKACGRVVVAHDHP